MSGREDAERRSPREAAPATAQEALARARRHARAALAESVEALRALLDAASLAATGVPSESQRWLARAARLLEALAADLDSGGRDTEQDSLLLALADALDAEITRWETRAQDDPDARAVLRAFLGLRELLWELGIRRPPEAPTDAARNPGDATTPPQSHRARSTRPRKPAKPARSEPKASEGGPLQDVSGPPQDVDAPPRRRVKRVQVEG